MRDHELIRILKRPHLAEKTSRLQGDNVITLVVDLKADKSAIARAVEAIYNKKVLAVNTVRVKGKERRFGRRVGRGQDWKKAYVTMERGDIDIETQALSNVDDANKVVE